MNMKKIFDIKIEQSDDIELKGTSEGELPQELEDRFLAGEAVPAEEYYYKGSVCFNAGDSRCKWLENRVFMCDGIIEDWSSLRFAVYEV